MAWRDRLNEMREELVQRLKCEPVIIILQTKGKLTDDEVEDIEAKAGRRNQANELVNVLRRKTEKHLDAFVEALRNVDLADLADKLSDVVVQRPAPPSRRQEDPVMGNFDQIYRKVAGESPICEIKKESHHPRYAMNHKKRGICVLVKQKEFNDPQLFRPSADSDAQIVEETFRTLRFEVQCHTNLSVKELMDVIKEASERDHSECDCFAFVIMSHGIGEEVCCKDESVAIKNLIGPFRGDCCPSLIGKPKLFFFQACRGVNYDPGTDVADSIPVARVAGATAISRIPIEADFLLSYSTVPDFAAWGNQAGSWFIQSLCKVLQENALTGTEMTQMLLLVNNMVATLYESKTYMEESDKKKQMPTFDCRLTKQLYFN